MSKVLPIARPCRRILLAAVSVASVALYAPLPAQADPMNWVATCGAGGVSASNPGGSSVGPQHVFRARTFTDPITNSLTWGTENRALCTMVRDQAHGTQPKLASMKFKVAMTQSQLAALCTGNGVTLHEPDPVLVVDSEGWQDSFIGGWVKIDGTGQDLVVRYEYEAPGGAFITAAATLTREANGIACTDTGSQWFGAMEFVDPVPPELPA